MIRFDLGYGWVFYSVPRSWWRGVRTDQREISQGRLFQCKRGSERGCKARNWQMIWLALNWFFFRTFSRSKESKQCSRDGFWHQPPASAHGEASSSPRKRPPSPKVPVKGRAGHLAFPGQKGMGCMARGQIQRNIQVERGLMSLRSAWKGAEIFLAWSELDTVRTLLAGARMSFPATKCIWLLSRGWVEPLNDGSFWVKNSECCFYLLRQWPFARLLEALSAGLSPIVPGTISMFWSSSRA